MNRPLCSDQRGFALLCVLGTMILLLPMVLFVTESVRIDWSLHHRLAAETETFYAADSILAVALADVRRYPSFERLTHALSAGGSFPFFSSPPPPPMGPRISSHLHLSRLATDQLEIAASASFKSASQTVRASVLRSPFRFVPAALFSTVTNPDNSLLAFTVSGNDRSNRDAAVPPTGGPLRSDVTLADLGFGSFQSLATLPSAMLVFGDLHGATIHGLIVSRGSTTVAEVSGSGLFLIAGDLVIAGPFRFEGLVVVLGDIRSMPGSRVDLAGALLQERPGQSMDLRGEGSIVYDSDAISEAAALAPDWIPHRAVIGGWLH